MAVFVVGSINADVTLAVARLPAAGSTVMAGEPLRSGGGKGANVAVAAARAGAEVRLIAAIGDDPEGDASRRELGAEGVDLAAVEVREGQATGLAMICVDERGANFIVVAPGANAELSAESVIAGLRDLSADDVCVVNFEIPGPAVAAAASVAGERGARVLLNPSPVRPLAPELLTSRTTLIVNASELEELAGEEGIGAAGRLRARGCGAVVVTLGGDGVHVLASGVSETVPAFPAKTVDTTGAGDTFTGVLAGAVAEGADLLVGVRRGAAAGALATERIGARAAMPRRPEIDRFGAAAGGL
jgi:ribokinase